MEKKTISDVDIERFRKEESYVTFKKRIFIRSYLPIAPLEEARNVIEIGNWAKIQSNKEINLCKEITSL